MGMSTGSSRGTIADINVTPMADVMIVLLIIFMVATPMITQDAVTLPGAAHGAEDKRPKPLVIVLKTGGALKVDGTELGPYEPALAQLTDIASSAPGRAVWIKADKVVPYSWVSAVLDACRRAGAEEIHFATTVPEVQG